MGRARSAIAAQTTIESLREAMLQVFPVELTEEGPECEDFFDAADYCRPHTEELGGDAGADAWYFWRQGKWAIAGDLGLSLCRNGAALEELSRRVGDLVVGAIDDAFEYALFAVVVRGEIKRRLTLEDDVCVVEGLPTAAERGRHLIDFDLAECEHLWTSHGLPTFDHDPLEGPFKTVALRRKD